MTNHPFASGIQVLLQDLPHLIAGRNIGVVTHLAAVDSTGASSASLLAKSMGRRLKCIMGPEHGFFGIARAGEHVTRTVHPHIGCPVYSLYGNSMKPSRNMLKDVSTIVFDLQDLGARPYTYVSTLLLVLEAAASMGKRVVIADRPIPLPSVVDGPMQKDSCRSFVGLAPVPLAYGMTPGETALFLNKALNLQLDLHVATMRGYARDGCRNANWPWIPPSPGIVSWESAQCYTATVFFEALPAIDHGRGTGLPFQVFGAPWTNGVELSASLASKRLPGVVFHPHQYTAKTEALQGKIIDGVRMTVTDPRSFRPVRTAVQSISCLQELHGVGKIWGSAGTRPEFFDKLAATTSLRTAIIDGESPDAIASSWDKETRSFRAARRQFLLYNPK